jgi:hypothetical protein
VGAGELGSVAFNQRDKRLREILGPRKPDTMNKHRHDADVPLQSRFDLKTNVVLRIVEPTATVTVGGTQPIAPHDDE